MAEYPTCTREIRVRLSYGPPFGASFRSVVIAEAIVSRQAGYLCAARAILIADVEMRDTGKISVTAPGLTSRINADPDSFAGVAQGQGRVFVSVMMEADP